MADKASRLSEKIFKTLLDELDVGIRVVDKHERPIIYNKRMKQIESMTLEDFTEKKITEVIQFDNEQDSRLLQALHSRKIFKNKKQTYFNNKGREITTINHTFPIIHNDEVIAAAEIAKDVTQLVKLRRDRLKRNRDTSFTFEDIIGRSSAMLDLAESAQRATRTSSSILIIGETGTGKELFSQSIHNGSDRPGPYVSQNCAALPESLIEGILFGTVSGAFTGAVDRKGLFEEAEGGTLLLDEINSLPISLQAKLLRVIQEKKITRIGDNKERSVDIRIMATMNEDPFEAIAQNRLRKDLYYRLGVVTLFVPPLRERREEIFDLSMYFVEKYNTYFQMQVEGIDEEVMQKFLHYSWPGNVRELEHVIEGAMNLILDEQIITANLLPPHFLNKTTTLNHKIPDQQSMRDKLGQVEQQYIIEALERHSYNVLRAAKYLGMSRQSLQYRMDKFKITKKPKP
ncbi:sigma-54 interaction domain-containing protein [Alteribacillus sp. HJP-4]|uniref:sigma-54 interaction domain-containing protein n=1 Tax=Alteribacillus sp. HJP-4 TaxID=2775394 RepID=UPI0035CD02E6